MDKVALDQSFLRALRVSLVSIVPPISSPFFVYTLRFPEQKRGEVWGGILFLKSVSMYILFAFKGLTEFVVVVVAAAAAAAAAMTQKSNQAFELNKRCS